MIRKILLFFLFCPVLAFADDIKIEGRVFTESGQIEGAKVYVYKKYEDIQANNPVLISEPTDNKSMYKIQLPEGEYYFTAGYSNAGKEFFAYHGSNPVKVSKGNLWLALMMNEIKPPVYSDGPTSLGGVVTYKGKAVKNAYIALYKPDAKIFRGLGVRTESVNADGTFNLSVPDGKYVVIARKTEGDKKFRPIRKGDLFCYYSQNPLEVRPDKTVQIEVPCYPKDDRSSFVEAPFLRTDDYATIETLAAGSNAGIKGRVTDKEGKPAAGIVVLAYKTESPVFMMYHLSHGTEYSGETDKDGNYFVPLDKAGDYTVVARDILGEGPHRGEIYGLYQGNHRHVVFYKTGELQDKINIIAGEVMQELLKDIPNLPENVGIKTDTAATGDSMILTNQVIDKDTVWQGNILIKGVVSVKRGATLIINPGTIVKFSRLDQDNNGVGDGEILVEGRLVAKGTKEKRIIFTSASDDPQINDWSYIQFLAAENGSAIEYCRFEWAYAGVMVHYSNVKITDCVFTNNNRGLHFNTANLLVEHNTFTNNKIGIRFMRFEGGISVNKNTIYHNDIGVLFVRQHVNAVNFWKLEKKTEPPHFFDNNICSNNKYNISLGYGQDQDVNFAGNWWCELKEERIAKTIYDNKQDKELSTVVFSPFRTTAVQGAGIRE